jgi:hypothetical protein
MVLRSEASGNVPGMPDEENLLHLTFDVQPENIVRAYFVSESSRRGFRHLAFAQWPSHERFATKNALASSVGEEDTQACFDIEGSLCFVVATFGFAHAFSAARSTEEARAALHALRGLVPEAEPTAGDGVVPVTFWAAAAQGPIQVRRDLDAPAWEEIADNYETDTHGGLARLMDSDFRPARGGQLLLWHGETGTGKTTALRALARQWREWCTLHYITDPEKFFGDLSDYMLTVMMEHHMDQFDDDDMEFAMDFAEGIVGPTDLAGRRERAAERHRWRLLVLEDAGELLAVDARAATGQGLSRFLNSVDGLIGQGLRFLILVTTNEELGKLHPAVSRPGRAASRIPFNLLPQGEARGWLERHGVADPSVEGAMTLASLYARIENFEEVAASPRVGFRP